MAEPTRKSHVLWDCLWIGGLCLALFGILYALSSPIPTAKYLNDAKKARAQLGCKSLEMAIEAYIQHKDNTKHEFPNTPNDLFEPPFGGPPFLRNGRADLIDPWGKPYEFERARYSDGVEFILVKTTAPDGTPISQFGIRENARPKP